MSFAFDFFCNVTDTVKVIKEVKIFTRINFVAVICNCITATKLIRVKILTSLITLTVSVTLQKKNHATACWGQAAGYQPRPQAGG